MPLYNPGSGTVDFANVNAALATADAAVDLNAQKITSLADGTASDDAATKGQLDAVSAGGATFTAVKDALAVADTAVDLNGQELTGIDDGGSADSAASVGQVTAAQAAAQAASVPTARTITAGTGLTGGGDLSANRTLAPDFGTGAGKVTQGNDSRLSDSRAPNGSAGGDLGGTYPSPTVAAIHETAGPTKLTIGAIADGQAVVRSGSTLIGAAPGGSGTLQDAYDAGNTIDVEVAATPTAPFAIRSADDTSDVLLQFARWSGSPGVPATILKAPDDITGVGATAVSVAGGDGYHDGVGPGSIAGGAIFGGSICGDSETGDGVDADAAIVGVRGVRAGHAVAGNGGRGGPVYVLGGDGGDGDDGNGGNGGPLSLNGGVHGAGSVADGIDGPLRLNDLYGSAIESHTPWSHDNTLTLDGGAYRQIKTEGEFAFSSTPSLDVSKTNTWQMTGTLTGTIAFTFTGFQDGDSLRIGMVQDGTGHKITGVTASGRTALMDADLTTLNTAAFLTPSKYSELWVDFMTVNSVPLIVLSIKPLIAAAFT